MQKAFGMVWLAYLVAGLVAVATGIGAEASGWHPIAVALAADVAATVAIFIASLIFRNSSFYDPYWSVAPPLIALYFALRPASADASGLRSLLGLRAGAGLGGAAHLELGARLAGLGHEDWRYRRLQQQTGRAYWLVSFTGIHLMPDLLGLRRLPAFVPGAGRRDAAFRSARRACRAGDGGLDLDRERADDQLRRFRAEGHGPQAILETGVWAWSRHPNYFGEMGFWWGLWLFGARGESVLVVDDRGADLDHADVPLREPADGRTRMLESRPAYADHSRLALGCVILRPPRRSAG